MVWSQQQRQRGDGRSGKHRTASHCVSTSDGTDDTSRARLGVQVVTQVRCGSHPDVPGANSH